MKKPAELRAHLTQWVPDIATNPDKLHIFVDKGRVVSRVGQGLSFEYHFQLRIIVTDFAEPADALTVPLLVWISEHQPNLLLDEKLRQSVIGIEAEIIDHDKIDIALTLELSERVLLKPAPDGGYVCQHVAEPALPEIG